MSSTEQWFIDVWLLDIIHVTPPQRKCLDGYLSTHMRNRNNGIQKEEPGSSVSTVSDYGLDEFRSPAEAKVFSSNLCVQTGSEAHPASCTMGTGGSFTGAKRGRGVTLTAHPHLVPRSRMGRSCTFFPPKRHHGVKRDCFAFLEYKKLSKVRFVAKYDTMNIHYLD
jgi:hypothetical protein